MSRTLVAAGLVFGSILVASTARSAGNDPIILFGGKNVTLDAFRGRAQLDPREEAKFDDKKRAAMQAEWDADAKKHWKVEKDEIVSDGEGVFLTSKQEFRDFEMNVDWMIQAMGDSGIYLKSCPQVQIWDTTEKGGKWNLGADKGSGGLWNNEVYARFPTKAMDKAFGQWNSFRIVQVGARTSVWMNGELVTDHVPMENYFDRGKPIPVKGPIQLQTHGSETRFRNVTVREIGADEANEILGKHNAEGFVSVFNGKDFTGWSGPTDGYEITPQGTIRCRAGAGGTIFTKEEYGDFVARLEFKLPPGGNNGLAIRYPGEGDSAYVGMCEVQVLDDTAEQYANLKEWQFCGSVYGQVPAQKGYLRAVGEWNSYEVTVVGHKIRVELNGTIIVDADIEKTQPLSGDHPGRLRTNGHFGFCGHNDPVEFRNVRIKKLGAS